MLFNSHPSNPSNSVVYHSLHIPCLKLTAISSLKIGQIAPKRKRDCLPLPPLFRCKLGVSFRECISCLSCSTPTPPPNAKSPRHQVTRWCYCAKQGDPYRLWTFIWPPPKKCYCWWRRLVWIQFINTKSFEFPIHRGTVAPSDAPGVQRWHCLLEFFVLAT